jgi:hypothetical protein
MPADRTVTFRIDTSKLFETFGSVRIETIAERVVPALMTDELSLTDKAMLLTFGIEIAATSNDEAR